MAWGQALASDTTHLEPFCAEENAQTKFTNGAPITPADVVRVGVQCISQALDDGSCVHPGTRRLAGLSRCAEDVVISAMRVLRQSGWAEIQQRPTRTSPTVHRLTVRNEYEQ